MSRRTGQRAYIGRARREAIALLAARGERLHAITDTTDQIAGSARIQTVAGIELFDPMCALLGSGLQDREGQALSLIMYKVAYSEYIICIFFPGQPRPCEYSEGCGDRNLWVVSTTDSSSFTVLSRRFRRFRERREVGAKVAGLFVGLGDSLAAKRGPPVPDFVAGTEEESLSVAASRSQFLPSRRARAWQI